MNHKQKEPKLDTKTKIWNKLEKQIEADIHKQHRRIILKNISIAASIIMLFSISTVFLYQSFFASDIYEANTEQKIVMLQDGTKVILMPAAKLRVKKNFPAEIREVSLKGDAVFEVTKSEKHPFIVYAENFEVKVLGTIFKVTQSKLENRVDLFEGAVEIKKELSQDVLLKPNQTWTDLGNDKINVVLATNLIKTNKSTTQPTVPTIETLSFSNISLDELSKIIQKNYNLKLNYPNNLTEKEVSGTLGRIDEINKDIEMVGFSIGLTTVKTPDGFELVISK